MTTDRTLARYRKLYAWLVRLYPARYRERFAEEMKQTFDDLLRERAKAGDVSIGFVAGLVAETSVGILQENRRSIVMNSTGRRLIGWVAAIGVLLSIPFALTILGGGKDGTGFHWTPYDFAVMASALFGVALAHELIARRYEQTRCRVAFGLALATALLLGWVNSAVGIIGDEGNPANLSYTAILAVGILVSAIVRFKPYGMARTLAVVAVAQAAVPVIALGLWPPQQFSWGGAGVPGVFVLNTFFASLFASAALLFWKSAGEQRPAVAEVRSY